MQRSQSVRFAAAIALAALINALLLAAILFQRVAVSWPAVQHVPALSLDLSRPFPEARPHKNTAPERARAATVTDFPAPPSPVSPTPPSPLQAAPNSATSPAPATDDVQAKASAALRTLQACGDFTDPSHEVRCGTAWQGHAEGVETLSPAERAEFAADKPDLDARIARSAALRKSLGDHSGEGNSFHYGCSLMGGKLQCGTY